MLPGKQNIAEVLEHCISNVDKHLHDRIMPLLEERADIKVKIAGVSLMSEGGPVGFSSFQLAALYRDTVYLFLISVDGIDLLFYFQHFI